MVDKEYDLLSTEMLGFPLRDPELVPTTNLGREDVRCDKIPMSMHKQKVAKP